MSTSSQAEPTFTRSKGGTAEREEIISQIQVPDLWKIAEIFQEPKDYVERKNIGQDHAYGYEKACSKQPKGLNEIDFSLD